MQKRDYDMDKNEGENEASAGFIYLLFFRQTACYMFRDKVRGPLCFPGPLLTAERKKFKRLTGWAARQGGGKKRCGPQQLVTNNDP